MRGPVIAPWLVPLATVLLVFGTEARAQTKPSEAPVPNCMDQSISSELGEELRPRGVQKRVFLKKGQIALVAHGGLFAADLLSSSYSFGGDLTWFFTEDFALDISFDVTPVRLDLDAPVSEFLGNEETFDARMAYMGMANLLWSPIHAKLKMGGGIVHTDIYLLAGGGRLFHDSVQGVTFNAGFAIDMLLTQWVTLRWQLRDVVAIQEAVAETRLTNNVLGTLGIALWIPTPL